MRHGKKFNHLSRTASHRSAMLSNMASSLILHKRISTTVAKAKELRKYVEPLLTKSKNDTTHSRRVVFSYLNNKESVKALFNEVAEKISARPGGYTRIVKLGNRLGDNADMCIIELVDYNENLLKEAAPAKTKTRRSRRGAKGKASEDNAAEAKVETTEAAAKAGTAVAEEKETKAPETAEKESKAEAPAEAKATEEQQSEAREEEADKKDADDDNKDENTEK